MNEQTNINIIKLNDIRNFVKANVELQMNQKWSPRLYIQGAPGCGKSYILRDICIENGWALKTFFVSNSAIEMLTGLPCKVQAGEGAAWSRPEILDMSESKLEYKPENYESGKTPTILLLDDFHLCDRMMQRYMFQLFTEMGLNGYKLPNHTAIIIAGNRIQDKAGAMPIPAPVCNRMMFIEVTSQSEDWLKNFAIKHNVRGDITTFIANRGDMFLSQEPIESTAWASPRAWTYLSSQMDSYEQLMGTIDLNTLMIMANGLIGPEYAKEFVMYRELFAKWNFTELQAMNWDVLKTTFKKAISNNATTVYAIINAGVVWLINEYKKSNYNIQDSTVKKAANFVYSVLAFLLATKYSNVSTRPLVVAGVKFLHLYQESMTENSTLKTRQIEPILSLLLQNLHNQRNVDWILYELLANTFNIPLTDSDINSINNAKEEIGKNKIDI